MYRAVDLSSRSPPVPSIRSYSSRVNYMCRPRSGRTSSWKTEETYSINFDSQLSLTPRSWFWNELLQLVQFATITKDLEQIRGLGVCGVVIWEGKAMVENLLRLYINLSLCHVHVLHIPFCTDAPLFRQNDLQLTLSFVFLIWGSLLLLRSLLLLLLWTPLSATQRYSPRSSYNSWWGEDCNFSTATASRSRRNNNCNKLPPTRKQRHGQQSKSTSNDTNKCTNSNTGNNSGTGNVGNTGNNSIPGNFRSMGNISYKDNCYDRGNNNSTGTFATQQLQQHIQGVLRQPQQHILYREY